MSKQYDVYVIESLVDKNHSEGCDLAWWANNPQRQKGDDGTFVMFNCERNSDGSFVAVGFVPVYIPEKCIKRYEACPDGMEAL